MDMDDDVWVGLRVWEVCGWVCGEGGGRGEDDGHQSCRRPAMSSWTFCRPLYDGHQFGNSLNTVCLHGQRILFSCPYHSVCDIHYTSFHIWHAGPFSVHPCLVPWFEA